MKQKLLVLLSILLIYSCKEVNLSHLNVDKDKLIFESEGGTSSFLITSNTSWNIKNDNQSWYHLNIIKEKDYNAKVEVIVNAVNDTIARAGRLSIVSDGKLCNLAIIQNRKEPPPKPYIPVFLVSKEEHSQTIQIDIDEEFTTSLPESAKEYVDLIEVKKASITLKFKANKGKKYRTFRLALNDKNNKLLQTIELRQSWRSVEQGEILIEEIFFTGNIIPNGKRSDSSDGDQYFIFRNNSDRDLYLDKLGVAISKYDSQADPYGYYAIPPLKDSICINTIYQFPGSGREYPIKAGESKLVAIEAQNFKEGNAKGFDLSNADFEFFDPENDGAEKDNPRVKNMLTWLFTDDSPRYLHDRGYKSYAVVTLPDDLTPENYINDNRWDINEVFIYFGKPYPNGVFPASNAFLIPNEWIIDGVNCAVFFDLSTLAFNPKIDAGYASVDEENPGDSYSQERYGKAVKRKSLPNGKLQDTNNSLNDFEHNAIPSKRDY